MANYANCPQCGEEVKVNDMPTAAGEMLPGVAAGKGSQSSKYRVRGRPVECPKCGHSFRPTDLRLEKAE
jgi:Zn ribbon nucleic-acid-binding protein